MTIRKYNNTPPELQELFFFSLCAHCERELAGYELTCANPISNSSGSVGSFRLLKNNLLRKVVGTFIKPYKVNDHF